MVVHGGGSTRELNTAGQLLVWAVRRWVGCGGRPTDCRAQMTDGFRVAGLDGGLLLLDRLMMTFAITASPGLAICPLRCRRLAPDEQLLLDVIAGYQAGADCWAEETLAERLPPAGVRWAGEAAQALALVMSAAGLKVRPPVIGALAWHGAETGQRVLH